ncbi:unnamed protein product [Ectocarpus fasciculatus]
MCTLTCVWLPVLTATLCVTGAGGFHLPTVGPTGGLKPSPTSWSSRCHASRCSRRRLPTTTTTTKTSRTIVMMAGPNQGQKPGFFAEWPVLEAEIRAYLAERQAGDPEKGGGGGVESKGAGGTLLNFLSVNPTQMALENEPDRDEWDGEVNVLSYSELTRYGYGYLIEPMMKIGGYVAASERMGIDLNARTLKDNEYYERINPTVGLDIQKKADKDGFLTLGSAKEERLNSVANVSREDRRKSLFEKQAMMDKKAKAEKAATKKSRVLNTSKPKVPVNLGGRSQKEVDEEIFRKPGLTAEQRDISEWVPEVRAEDALPAQPLLLNFAQRANAVAVCGCLSLAFGKGTLDALETGLLPRDVAEVAVPASLFLLGLNVASAVAGASIAKSKGRSVPLWVFKGALAGLTSVLELKGLPELVPLSSSGASAGPQPSGGASDRSSSA